MRSAERLIARGSLVAASVALAACSSMGDLFGASAATTPKPTPPAAPVAAASVAKSAPATQAAKPMPPVRPAAQKAFDAARQALAAGRAADAERGFVALTKSDPDLSGPYANLGLIYRQAGKTAEATAALEKAVRLSPDSAELCNQLGVTYRMAGDFAKSKAAYEKALALDASYAPAVLNLGILYDLYLWDGARALELYDRYLQLTPAGDAEVQRWVRDLRNRTARKNAPQSKEQG
jgi:tetratricopeptide (TPR) repeat protein